MSQFRDMEDLFLRIDSVHKLFGRVLSREGFERPYLLAKTLLSYALLDDGGISGKDLETYLKESMWAEYDQYSDLCNGTDQTINGLLSKKYILVIDSTGVPALGSKYNKYVTKCRDWNAVRKLIDEESTEGAASSRLDDYAAFVKQEMLDQAVKILDAQFDKMFDKLKKVTSSSN